MEIGNWKITTWGTVGHIENETKGLRIIIKFIEFDIKTMCFPIVNYVPIVFIVFSDSLNHIPLHHEQFSPVTVRYQER